MLFIVVGVVISIRNKGGLYRLVAILVISEYIAEAVVGYRGYIILVIGLGTPLCICKGRWMVKLKYEI